MNLDAYDKKTGELIAKDFAKSFNFSTNGTMTSHKLTGQAYTDCQLDLTDCWFMISGSENSFDFETFVCYRHDLQGGRADFCSVIRRHADLPFYPVAVYQPTNATILVNDGSEGHPVPADWKFTKSATQSVQACIEYVLGVLSALKYNARQITPVPQWRSDHEYNIDMTNNISIESAIGRLEAHKLSARWRADTNDVVVTATELINANSDIESTLAFDVSAVWKKLPVDKRRKQVDIIEFSEKESSDEFHDFVLERANNVDGQIRLVRRVYPTVDRPLNPVSDSSQSNVNDINVVASNTDRILREFMRRGKTCTVKFVPVSPLEFLHEAYLCKDFYTFELDEMSTKMKLSRWRSKSLLVNSDGFIELEGEEWMD